MSGSDDLGNAAETGSQKKSSKPQLISKLNIFSSKGRYIIFNPWLM